jgi:hypothetical protein
LIGQAHLPGKRRHSHACRAPSNALKESSDVPKISAIDHVNFFCQIGVRHMPWWQQACRRLERIKVLQRGYFNAAITAAGIQRATLAACSFVPKRRSRTFGRNRLRLRQLASARKTLSSARNLRLQPAYAAARPLDANGSA